MTARSWLRLCRAPNVFTAIANVTAGVLLARLGGFHAADLLLLAASAAFYIAGMILNDYFDRKIDAVERPERPIPSGEISPRAASAVGFALLLVGGGASALHGMRPLLVALLLAACIVGYDAGLKDTVLGPFAMGACRFCNVLLGLSVSATWATPWIWAAPAAMGAFTVAVTFLSRSEVHGAGHARAFVLSAGLIYLGASATAALLSVKLSPAIPGLAAMFALLVYLLVRGARLYRPLLSSAAPSLVGRAIGGSILMMPAVDSLYVAAAGMPAGAAAVVALTLPALLLKRWFYMT